MARRVTFVYPRFAAGFLVLGLLGLALSSVRRVGGAPDRASTEKEGSRAGEETRSPLLPGTSLSHQDAVRLGKMSDPGAVPELRRLALTAQNPLIAGNALQALGSLGAVSKDPELVAMVQDPRPRIRQEMVLALGKSRDPSVVPILCSLLEGSDAMLRPIVIQALGTLDLDGTKSRDALRSILEDSRSSVTDRAFARAALDGRTR